jgi:hypothetical protein
MFYLSILLLGLVNFFLGFRVKGRNLVEFFAFQFLLICAQIILLFEILSFLKVLNQPVWFIGLQCVFLLLAIIIGWKNRKELNSSLLILKTSWQDLTDSLRRNKFFTVYAILILIIYLGIAALSMSFPQTTSDSLYNHLSRIGHWLQQGSLLPYSSFTEYAVTYPYNNSLLMMWSVLFLKDDILVGLTQWFSCFLLAASIFGIGVELNLPRKASAYAALIFLTFPIVALEAGTAQNDILAAAFFICATWLTIISLRQKSRTHMIFAGVALGLAIGTKQYVLYALPGLLVLILYLLRKEKPSTLWKSYQAWLISAALFTLLLGSYTYLQNFISFGNFFVKEEVQMLSPTSMTDLPPKFAYNTSRLATQFISCDGLPVPWNASCLAVKEKIFSNLFSSIKLDLTKNVYMLEENCRGTCFEYGKKFMLNEESAWFGPLSWMLIPLGAILLLIVSLKKKNALPLILLVSAYFFFAVTAMFKIGWDAYLGRYLILSTGLIAPFMALCLQEKKLWQKVITRSLALFSILILLFSVLANDSRPIITKTSLTLVQDWGRENNLILVTKIAYKITPGFPTQRSYAEIPQAEIKTLVDSRMTDYLKLVKKYSPLDGQLAIINTDGIFLDYYLFGDNFTRKLFEFSYQNNMEQIVHGINDLALNTILVKTDLAKNDPPAGFVYTSRYGQWSIYQRK